MKKSNSESSPKLDRKTLERNRRIQMKGLCFKLSSLMPPQHFKTSQEMLSRRDQLDLAASYITELREKVDKLKRTKELILGSMGFENNTIKKDPRGSKLPVVELREMGSAIEVVLISGLNKYLMSYIVTILEEEGAEVVTASFSRVGGEVCHTVHAQVKISRVGVDISRVYERLQELVYQSMSGAKEKDIDYVGRYV